MTIHAFTELHNDYPAFVNLTEKPDGSIALTVRSRGNGGNDVASINLTGDQLRALVSDASKYLGAAAKPTYLAAISLEGLRTARDNLVRAGNQFTVVHNGTQPIAVDIPALNREFIARGLPEDCAASPLQLNTKSA